DPQPAMLRLILQPEFTAIEDVSGAEDILAGKRDVVGDDAGSRDKGRLVVDRHAVVDAEEAVTEQQVEPALHGEVDPHEPPQQRSGALHVARGANVDETVERARGSLNQLETV